MLMHWHDRAQFGIVAPIMHPAQRVLISNEMVDCCVIAQQLADDRDGGLGVIGSHRQRIPNLLALLDT